VRRSEQRHGDRGDDGEAIRRRRRGPGGRHHRSTSQRRGADDSDAGQHPLTTNPVGHRREERRQQRRGRHAGGRTAPTAATPPSRNATTASATMNALSPAHIAANEVWARRSGPLCATWPSAPAQSAEPRRDTNHHDATISKRAQPGTRAGRQTGRGVAGASTTLPYTIPEILVGCCDGSGSASEADPWGCAVPDSNGRPPACKARADAAVYCRLSLNPLRKRSRAADASATDPQSLPHGCESELRAREDC
jgi:hypothetical protein